MKTINVEIKGTSPLLMNNPISMIEQVSSGIKNKTEKMNLQDEAKKLLYKKKDGELYIPATAIKGALIGAASYKKIGKYAAKPMIAGGVFIIEDEIGLGTKDYELDVRTVVIQRARVVKARPKLISWTAKFKLTYNEKLIDAPIIKGILEEAGERVGLLDFRPSKLGSFGMFKVTQWKEE